MRFLMTCFVILILIFHNTASNAQPEFLIHDEHLEYTLPLPGSPSEKISFILSSKSGEISNVDVRIQEIKDPGGWSRPISILKASIDESEITSKGARITLEPQVSEFIKPGKYHVTLLIEGKGPGDAPVSLTTTIILILPLAKIDVESLKERTIELSRCWPNGEAKITVPFYFVETTSNSIVRNLKVLGQEIFLEGSKVVVPGKVLPKLPQLDSAPIDSIDPGGQIEVNVDFSGLKLTGNFVTDLIVSSPSLEKRQSIPIKLRVTDKWIFPLLIIFLGVLGGFFTNYLSQKWKPRKENDYRILKLRSELNELSRGIKAPEKVEKLYNIRQNLLNAEEQNDRGDADSVKPLLDKIQNDLDAFRKLQVKEAAETLVETNSLKTEVELIESQLKNIKPDEATTLQSILRQTETIKNQLSIGEVDTAKETFLNSQKSFSEFRKGRLRKELEEQQRQISTMQLQLSQNPKEEQQIESLSKEVEEAISNGKFNEARQKLDERADTIKNLASRVSRGARPISSLTTLLPTFGQKQLLAARQEIVVLNQPENRTTLADIHFQIKMPQNTIQSGDQFQWDFGDGTPTQEGNESISHRFQRPGAFRVETRLIRSGQHVKSLSEVVNILPGQVDESLQKIKRSILMSDFFISGIALILASLTGLLYLYVGKPFGSLSDYLLALLWGFGLDNSVRGFAGVLKKVTGD